MKTRSHSRRRRRRCSCRTSRRRRRAGRVWRCRYNRQRRCNSTRDARGPRCSHRPSTSLRSWGSGSQPCRRHRSRAKRRRRSSSRRPYAHPSARPSLVCRCRRRGCTRHTADSSPSRNRRHRRRSRSRTRPLFRPGKLRPTRRSACSFHRRSDGRRRSHHRRCTWCCTRRFPPRKHRRRSCSPCSRCPLRWQPSRRCRRRCSEGRFRHCIAARRNRRTHHWRRSCRGRGRRCTSRSSRNSCSSGRCHTSTRYAAEGPRLR